MCIFYHTLFKFTNCNKFTKKIHFVCNFVQKNPYWWYGWCRIVFFQRAFEVIHNLNMFAEWKGVIPAFTTKTTIET